MRSTTHLNGGVMLGIVGANMNINNALPIISQIPVSPMHYGALIAGCALGSIVSDVDTPYSPIGKILKFVAFPLYLINWIFNKLKLRKLSQITGHRGIIHSLITWILLFIPYLLFLNVADITNEINQITIFFVLGLFIGALSHLFLDSMTKMGIPLFMPLSFKYFKLFKKYGVRTGSWKETIISLTLFIGNIFLILNYFNINIFDYIKI